MFERLRKILGVPSAEKSIQGAAELPEYLPASELAIHAEAAGVAGGAYRPWRCDPDGEMWLRLVRAGEGESTEAVEPEILESLEFDELLEPRTDLTPDELQARFQQRMEQRNDVFSDDTDDDCEFFGLDDEHDDEV